MLRLPRSDASKRGHLEFERGPAGLSLQDVRHRSHTPGALHRLRVFLCKIDLMTALSSLHA